MYPSQELDRFQLRLPPGLRDQIRIRAAIGRRSMNAEFLVLIERGIAADNSRQVQPLDQPIETAASMLQNVE
jgi:plasmid stability protein